MENQQPEETTQPGQYLVVARRYRPKDFTDLVGQSQVSTALANAIETNRVGHAYLFTGARGVGKTSTARILAKCLNCADGPTPNPCGTCDNCTGIATGEDVDVLEIDGASNRGIDEIRQLRSNVNIRPSRSRYKVYIIDEVHMLTTPAFNALLKTLEEPPEHVKFIFCTTDPEKIPITVISRCQRFDFSGIQTESIIGCLRHIVDTENAKVSDEALALLARRAGGSMRDSQSLLEQLLSFGGEEISVDDVHSLLGTADSGRIWELMQSVIGKDAATALATVDAALTEGADPGQVVEQLTAGFRDLMARHVGCGEEMLLSVSGEEVAQLDAAVANFPLPSVLAAMQILDESLTRMRQSTQPRMIAETALVRICALEQLESLATIAAELRAGNVTVPQPSRAAPAQKKTASSVPAGQRIDPAHRSAGSTRPSTAERSPPSSAPPAEISTDAPSATVATPKPAGIPFNEANLPKIWRQVLENLEGMGEMHASRALAPAISAPNRLALRFPATYTSSKSHFERPGPRQELEAALKNVVGETVRIELHLTQDSSPSTPKPHVPKVSQAQLRKQVTANPLVQTVAEMLDATVVAVEPPKDRST